MKWTGDMPRLMMTGGVCLELLACGEPFVTFEGDVVASGSGGDAGSTSTNVGTAQGGGGGSGADPVGGGAATGGGGSRPVCSDGAHDCAGDLLVTCVEGDWEVEVDCTDDADACIAGRCEDELVLLLRFEEGSGNQALDSGPTGYVGTVTQGSWIAGAVGGALELGPDGSVALGNVMNTLTLPISIAAWVKVSASPPAADMTLIALDTSGGTPYAGAWITIDGASGNNALSASFGNATGIGPSGRHSKASAIGVAGQTWSHVAAVLRGPSDISLYIDGLEVVGGYSGTATTMAFTAAPALVGISHWGGADLQYDGAVDELRIYSRALESAELVEIATP